MSYVRQVPKFLQAHAHLLGKGAVASMSGPEGATLVQEVDSDKEDDLEHDDGVLQLSSKLLQSAEALHGPCCLLQCPDLLCLLQGALQRAVADNPELAQQEPALLKLANKVTHTSTSILAPLSLLVITFV